MSNCCPCAGIETEFDRKTADSDLARYHEKGPDKPTRVLLDLLKDCGVEGATLLDVGGGVGIVPVELLAAGAVSATLVDASPAYIEAAREHAQHAGLAARITVHQGDFVEIADQVAPADIVTLHRVICCYPNMNELVQRSTQRAKRVYALTYPRDTWWMRLAVPTIPNLLFRLNRSQFRVHMHDSDAVDEIIRSEGFEVVRRRKTFLWDVFVYARKQGAE